MFRVFWCMPSLLYIAEWNCMNNWKTYCSCRSLLLKICMYKLRIMFRDNSIYLCLRNCTWHLKIRTAALSPRYMYTEYPTLLQICTCGLHLESFHHSTLTTTDTLVLFLPVKLLALNTTVCSVPAAMVDCFTLTVVAPLFLLYFWNGLFVLVW